MAELTIAFDGESLSNIEPQLRAGLQALAEETGENEHIETHVAGVEWQHDQWERGESCPECGGTQFHCGLVEYSVYEATDNGHMEYRERDGHRPTTDFTSVMCNNPSCMVQLYRGAASFLVD